MSIVAARPGRAALGTSAAIAAAVALGVAVAADTRVVFLLPAVAALVAAVRVPTHAIVGCLIASGAYNGLYFYIRISLGGVPLSVFDAVPFLLLIAACALRSRSMSRSRQSSTGSVAAACLAFGLVLGAAMGFAQHAATYQLFRVCRVEVDLLVGIAAVWIGSGSREWRAALKTGLVGAGVFVAIELVVGYVWLLKTGHTFWSLFPFGGDLQGGGYVAGSTDVNILRTNAISGYLMLPAFAFALVRLRRIDLGLIVLYLGAAAVSLSRGVWVSFFLAAFAALVFRLCYSRLGWLAVLRALGVTAAALVTAYALTGQVLLQRWADASRLGSSSGAAQDQSAIYRTSETSTALKKLLSSPVTAVSGTGAGVVIYTPGLTQYDAISPILENNLLARWTNFSIFSLIGTVTLLGGAFLHSWKAAYRGRRTHIPSLNAMALALPAALVAGLFGGTLMSPQNSLPLWLLAATMLSVAPHAESGSPKIQMR